MKIKYVRVVQLLFLVVASLSFLAPLLMTGGLSFYKTNYITYTFVGLNNYIKALTSPLFYQSILNSLFYFIYVSIFISISLLIALIVYSSKHLSVIKFIFYIPALSSGLIIAQIWRWVYHPSGLINGFLNFLGFGSINFFGSFWTAIPSLSLILGLSGLGGYLIYFLLSINAIPMEIFDQAHIDGASKIQISLLIIIPIIRKPIFTFLLIMFANSFMIWEIIYAVAPYDYTSSTLFLIYRTAFDLSNYGLSYAMTITIAIIISLLIIIKGKIENG